MANKQPNQKEESTERRCRKEKCSQDEIAVLGAATEKTFRAVFTGNFRQLDPVTGDASCEMRVPFILDAMDILEMSCFKPESLIPGFIAMYGPEINMLPADIGSKKASLPEEGTMPEHYFSLFYPLSVIRQRAEDSMRFIIDDRPEKMTYPTDKVNKWRSAAAQYSVDYMKKIAAFQATRLGNRTPVIGQISRLLNESRIEIHYGVYKHPILPIFATEYFLLQNEYLHGRPVVLVLTRWGYDADGNQYHFGTNAFMYSPNQAGDISDTGYKLVQTAPDAKVAETVYHAFNIFPLDQAEREEYGKKSMFC